MIVALAGGIGGAKLLQGLCRAADPKHLCVIANTGDDILLHGLRVCPDLDTIAYTLAGKVDTANGWGVAGDTFECLKRLGEMGAETWFQLGDRDLATHIFRTQLLAQGLALSEVTDRICRSLGLECQLLPMSEGYHPTLLDTDEGRLHLQEYLVRERCRPSVRRVIYAGIENAQAPRAALKAIRQAEAVVVCPSNPFISIGPILAVEEIRRRIEAASAPVAAVSPIVGGRALKGPAARMLQDLGHQPSALSVARLYADWVSDFILDRADSDLAGAVESLGLRVHVLDTVMNTLEDKARLARQLLKLL